MPPGLSERDLRLFYDPAGRQQLQPLTALLAEVAATRVPTVLAPAGRLVGHEVILAEALHAGLDTSAAGSGGPQSIRRPPRHPATNRHTTNRHAGAGTAAVLPIPAERQHAIADAVDHYARSVAAAVLDVADNLEHDLDRLRQRLPSLHRPVRSERLVLAGQVLAAVAHDGAVRRSGRAYYCHPDEVSSILRAAWRRQGRSEQDSELQTGRFVAYCHDAFEDTIDPQGGYLSHAPVIVSPRVALAVLQRLAAPDAAAAARALLLMTRTKAVDGSRMPYLDYLRRGTAEGGPYFTLTKAGDVHHNLTIEPEDIDPADARAASRYEKRELYRTAANLLRGAADDHDHGTAWTIHSIFAVRPTELRPSLLTDSANLGQIAAAVRERVHRA